MKLQQATRCALYAVLELAAHPDRQISAAEIAEKYGLSTNHLSKVLRDLGRAGLVEAVRGAGGGYRFCGRAKRTTLMDVIELFEDIDSGWAGGDNAADATPIGEALHVVMIEIGDLARATLQSITIDTLVNLMRKRRGRPNSGRAQESASQARVTVPLAISF